MTLLYAIDSDNLVPGFVTIIFGLLTIIGCFIGYIWVRKDKNEDENNDLLHKIHVRQETMIEKVNKIDSIERDVSELKGWKRQVDYRLEKLEPNE